MQRGLRLIRQWLAARSPTQVLCVGMFVVLAYAYPGGLTQDSLDHLREARVGRYTDGHPPFINLLWQWTENVVAGPFGMLCLQVVGFMLGLYGVLRTRLPAARAAWLAVAVFLFPPVLTTMAQIWKDCIMAAGLIAGVALLLQQSRASLVGGACALFVASAVRYNAPAATLALCLLLPLFSSVRKRWLRYGARFALWLSITGAAFSVNAALVDQPMYIWHSTLALHDIAGTLAKTTQAYSDDEMRALLARTEVRVDTRIAATIRERYRSRNFINLIWGEHALWDMPINLYTPAPAAKREAVLCAWQTLLRRHPLAYVRHRLSVFVEVLDLKNRWSDQAVPDRLLPKWPLIPDLGVTAQPSRWQDACIVGLRWLATHTPLFAPWLYALAALILLWLARRDVLARTLLWSGLLMEASLLPLAPSPDFRYSHWLVVCVVVALVLHVANCANRRPTAPAKA